ncbi:cytochrome b561 domain-containing protein [Rhodotorula paludigena]|uniref:cytochrome b561 domain-containing protein n=1 Tax=Rhodotorula paludigena TaxID=86838 RepID=UPI003180CD42
MPSGASTPPSALQIVARAAAGGAGLCAQLGLVVASVVLWRVLWLHPAGLFTYHPALQSLAFLGFLEGILLLQPQPPSAAHKRKGLQAHQAFQYISLVSIVAGASFIFYNKAIHGAKHFTTWHATFGLITLSLIFCQIVFGALVVYSPLQRWLGGEGRAKALWKYHRMSGYLTLSFLIVTPLLALASTWVQSNSSAFERVLIGSGIALAGAGAFVRIQKSKLGFRR